MCAQVQVSTKARGAGALVPGPPRTAITGGCKLSTWILGTKVRSSGRAVCALNDLASSPAFQWRIKYLVYMKNSKMKQQKNNLVIKWANKDGENVKAS